MSASILSTAGSTGIRMLQPCQGIPAMAGLRGPSMCTYVIDAVSTAAGGARIRVEIDLLRDSVTVVPAPVRPRPGWRSASIRRVTSRLRRSQPVAASPAQAVPPAGPPQSGGQVTGLPTAFAEGGQSPPMPIRPALSRPGASFDAIICGLGPVALRALTRQAGHSRSAPVKTRRVLGGS